MVFPLLKDEPEEKSPTKTRISVYSAPVQLKTIEQIEKELIELYIELCRGQMSEVARKLRIGRSTLYRKLKKHDQGAP